MEIVRETQTTWKFRLGKVNDKKKNKAEKEINEKYVIFLAKRLHAHNSIIKQRSFERLSVRYAEVRDIILSENNFEFVRV
jgi:hypothetical protein